MLRMRKSEVNIFGDYSVARVRKNNPFSYSVIRECDNVELARGYKFKHYRYDIIRTMYTGKDYGTGDIILVSDVHGVIHRFKD